MAHQVRIEMLRAPAVVAAMPDLAPLVRLPFNPDLVIAFLGFEDRVVGVPFQLAAGDAVTTRVLVGQYVTNTDSNQARRLELVDAWRDVGASECEFTPPGQVANRVRDLLKTMSDAVRRPLRVVVDISVASNVAIASVLPRLIREPDLDLLLVYAEAAHYEPESEVLSRHGLPDQAALEEGVSHVDVAPERAGYRVDGLRDAMAIIAGFGSGRARAAIAEIFPAVSSSVSADIEWILGVPPEDALRWRTEYSSEIHGLALDESLVHRVSTLDYREVMLQLEEIFERRVQTHHLTVVPLGSKMEAVGSVLFSFMRPEVRLLSVEPASYAASHYSHGIGSVWALYLGSTRSLREHLRSVDTMTVLS